MSVNGVIGIDFETYSAAPLPEVGLANYVADPTFRVLLCATVDDDGEKIWDFVAAPDPEAMAEELGLYVTGQMLAAHNAGFEIAVMKQLGIEFLPIGFYDTAVVASVAGAGRHLAQAARQLLDLPKLDEDKSLMRLFSFPKDDDPDAEFDPKVVHDNPDKWQEYKDYCVRDAQLSRQLYQEWQGDRSLAMREHRFAKVTQLMNSRGWAVDMDSVYAMQIQYERNNATILAEFQAKHGDTLNLNSNPQLVAWCKERGINATSFDKQAVEKMIDRLTKRAVLTPEHEEVLDMLRTKQALGGSSLKKLATIAATAHKGRLYDQYVHAGASQSLRTSGRSVQMQNLKRLHHVVDIGNGVAGWSNDQLSDNLRQVFWSPDGELVVADYSAIESRALAWLAGEAWKLDVYSTGVDLYKTQARKMLGIPASVEVTAEQRQTGKVGELSCGYGAGPVAVRDFAAKMGLTLTETQAKSLVFDWRDANPRTVQFWSALNDMLHSVVAARRETHEMLLLADGYTLTMKTEASPVPLQEQDPSVVTVVVGIYDTSNGTPFMQRRFHGCYQRGNNIGYYKPSSLKNGDPWTNTFIDQKTGLRRRYELYGGKLAGIITQSVCREIFFRSLNRLETRLSEEPNVQLIGQFHDEVVVEWKPDPKGLSLRELQQIMQLKMTNFPELSSLPLDVEVKHAQRYIK